MLNTLFADEPYFIRSFCFKLLGAHFIRTALRVGHTITAHCRAEKASKDSSIVVVNWMEECLTDASQDDETIQHLAIHNQEPILVA